MDEDHLSPLLGRLIDRAKAAALEAAPMSAETEGIALLLADETIVSAGALVEPTDGAPSAAERALAKARGCGDQAVEAAAAALFGVRVATALPGAASREVLRSIDPGLPLVVKYRGRWAVRLLSELPECAESV